MENIKLKIAEIEIDIDYYNEKIDVLEVEKEKLEERLSK